MIDGPLIDGPLIYGAYDTRTNEMRYVGQSKRYRKRCREHLRELRKNGPCSFARIGIPEEFVGWVVLEYLTPDDDRRLGELEDGWIEYFRSIGCDIVNINGGGGGHENWHPKGPNTPEHNAAVSQATKAAMARPEVRQRFLDNTINRPGWRENLSAKKMGDLNPAKRPEVRAKIGAGGKGRPPPNKGKKMSPEQHTKIVEVLKRARAALKAKRSS